MTAPIFFQDNPDNSNNIFNLLLSQVNYSCLPALYDMKRGLCEQRPFFIGIDMP